MGSGGHADDTGVVRVPADLDRPDQLLAGLSAHQLAILTAAGLAAWALAALADRWLGFLAAAIVAAPVVLAGLGLALGWRDGLPLDRLVLAWLAWAGTPRRRAAIPDPPMAAPGWAGPAGPRVAPLDGPISGLTASGVLELAGEGWALVCAATPVNLRLRTPAEQQQLLAGFARLLHALAGALQVVVRSQPADLAEMAGQLRSQAAGLAHPALEQAALAHARWLEQAAGDQRLRRRQQLVVFHQPPGAPDPAAALARQAEQAAGLLAAAGVTLTPLDANAAARVLQAAATPDHPSRPAGLALPGAVINGRPA
jgi:hypothetical protein